MKKINFLSFIALMSFFSLTALAKEHDEWNGCKNCETIVTLNSAKAQEFADAVMVISSMPLKGRVIDRGLDNGRALVLVGTYPNYASTHGLTSFDVAKIMTAWANDARFGISSVTATWNK